jgi:hypothetical protein
MAGYPKTGPVTSPSALGLDDRKIPSTFTVSAMLPGATPATAANFNAFWIAPFACRVVSIKESHGTAGSDGGAVSLEVYKAADGTAVGSGTNLQSAVINLKATADTVQTPALTATTADLTLAAGTRLGLKLTGTPTALASVVVTVELDAGQFDP